MQNKSPSEKSISKLKFAECTCAVIQRPSVWSTLTVAQISTVCNARDLTQVLHMLANTRPLRYTPDLVWILNVHQRPCARGLIPGRHMGGGGTVRVTGGVPLKGTTGLHPSLFLLCFLGRRWAGFCFTTYRANHQEPPQLRSKLVTSAVSLQCAEEPASTSHCHGTGCRVGPADTAMASTSRVDLPQLRGTAHNKGSSTVRQRFLP